MKRQIITARSKHEDASKPSCSRIQVLYSNIAFPVLEQKLKILTVRARAMAQQLSMCTALAENLNPVPSTITGGSQHPVLQLKGFLSLASMGTFSHNMLPSPQHTHN